MSSGAARKVTFDAEKDIQPFYTGGPVALDSEGRLLVTAFGEDAVLIDFESGTRLAYIEGDGEAITAIAITPSVSHLIICSRSLSMRIYALKPSLSSSYQIVASLQHSRKAHPTPVISTTVNSTGTLLATGGADGAAKVWDISGGYCTHTFQGHSGVVSALKFFEQSSSDITDSRRRPSGKRKSQGSEELAVVHAPSQKLYRLASAGQDGHVRIWDLDTTKKLKRVASLEAHSTIVRSLDYSSQEGVLISASRDKTLVVWDARTWKQRRTIPVLETIESAGFIHETGLVFTGGETSRVRVWNINQGRELTQEQASGSEEHTIVDVLHEAGLPTLVSVHADNSFELHSIEDLHADAEVSSLPIIRRISGTHDEIIDLAFLGTDQNLMALATNSEDIRIIDVSQSEEGDDKVASYFGADVGLLKGHDDIVICLDTDWSGCWIATGAKDNSIRLWSIDSKTLEFDCQATLTGHTESVGAVALSKTIPPKDSAAYNNPLSHPPSLMISGSQDLFVKIWDITSKKALHTRKAHDKDINALAIHPTLPLFASASQDRLVKIWSVETGETIGLLRGHKRGVWAAVFSPSNISSLPNSENNNAPSAKSKGYILTGSGDKTLKLWSLADYTCLRTFEGHSNSILKALWLPPSPPPVAPLIVSAAADGLVKIWDATSGDCVSTLDNHTDRIWALGLSETGLLVSGGADAVLTFWRDTTQETAAAAAQEESNRVEADQALQNYMRAKDYRAAISMALALDHPGRLLAIFGDVVEEGKEESSFSGVKAVDEVLGGLTDDQVRVLLRRCRDWNTNARNARVAQRVLSVILRLVEPERLVRIRGVPEIMEGLKAYSERHYKRTCELLDESWMIEYTLERMGVPPMKLLQGIEDLAVDEEGDVDMLLD